MKRKLTIVLTAILLIAMLTVQASAVFNVAVNNVELHEHNENCTHVYNYNSTINQDLGDDTIYFDTSLIETADMSVSVRKERNGQVLVILTIPTTESSIKVSSGSLTIYFNSIDMKFASISGYLFGETITTVPSTQINDEVPDETSIELAVTDTGSQTHSLPTLLRLYFDPVSLYSVNDQSSIRVIGSAISSKPVDATYTINESLTFAYCSHTHTYSIVTVQPTCKQEGVQTTYCEDCHLAISETYLARTDHSYSSNPARILKAPTCSQEGSGEFVCTVCHQTGYSKIPKLDHTFGIPYLKGGSYYVRCQICGTEELASKQCDHADSAYTYVSTEKEPTCIEEGVAIYKCSICGKLQYVPLEKVSHTWADIETIAEATPTQNGLKKQRCLVCGLVENHEYIYHTTHTYTGREEVISEATCDSNGQKRVYCTGCSEFILVDIPALGHKWSEWVVDSTKTCTVDGVSHRTCERCGLTEENVEKALGHKWSEWTIMVEMTCQNPGRQTRYCSVCNESEFKEIPQRAHTFNSTDYIVIAQPTCVSKGLERCICAECKTATNDREIDINPNAHNFSEWTTVTPATCLSEGLDTRVCQYCGKTETRVMPKVGHSFVELTVKGVTTKTCSVCKAVEVSQEVKKVTVLTEQSGLFKLTISDPKSDVFFLVNQIKAGDTQYDTFVEPFSSALKDRSQTIISAYEYQLKYGGQDTTFALADQVQIQLGDEYSKVDVKVWYLTQTGSLVPVDDKMVKRSKNVITIKGDNAFDNSANIIVLTDAGKYSNTSVALPIAIAVVTIVIVVGLVIFLRYREKKNSTDEIKDETKEQ